MFIGKMLSWASYLFGSSTTESEKETKVEQEVEQETMDTDASSDKDWVVVEHTGTNLVLHLLHARSMVINLFSELKL